MEKIRRSRWTVLAMVLITVTAYFWAQAQQGPTEDYQLPGARPIIDAGRYSSLQEAFDALPSEGGVVRIPPGHYLIERPLRVTRSDVLIVGEGTSTHIENRNASGEPALLLQHPSGEDSREAELWRVKIEDLRITGNEKSGHGIEARRINELFIEGVTVSEHGGDGLHMYFCYEDPRIVDSLITYNRKTGLNLVGCHDIVVSANQFEENQDALRCTDGYNLCMTGNNLDDHLGDGVVIENTYGSVVAGNMIEECAGRAIVLDRDCYGIALSANVIAHNRSGGIHLIDAHGSTVSANTFTIMGDDALMVGPGSGRIAVTGNAFSDSYVGRGEIWREPDDREAGGISLQNTRELAIVGNLLSGLRPKGLFLDQGTSREVLFSSNLLADLVSDHEKLVDSLQVNNLDSSREDE